MSNALLSKKLPNERVVNLSEADVDSTDSHHGPWECPSNSVKPVRG